MNLSEALEFYLRLKGSNKDKFSHRGAERNIKSVIDVSVLAITYKISHSSFSHLGPPGNVCAKAVTPSSLDKIIKTGQSNTPLGALN